MAENAPHATIVAHGAETEHAEPTAYGMDASQWVALAMLAVFAIMLWKRVPAMIGAALDKQIATIRGRLDEAEALRKDAEALKAEYQAKAASVDADAKAMLERAGHEAKAIVEQARVDAGALIEHRTKMAESKIEAAERGAVAELRARAASTAAAAAARLIEDGLDAKGDKALVDRAIAGLAAK